MPARLILGVCCAVYALSWVAMSVAYLMGHMGTDVFLVAVSGLIVSIGIPAAMVSIYVGLMILSVLRGREIE